MSASARGPGRSRRGAVLLALAVGSALLLTSAALEARVRQLDGEAPAELRPPSGGRNADTLWIFDADFEDLLGDNAGWDTRDWSGTPACTNYWHKDTIRIGGFTYLGDSTWWCGKYASCWDQPRGYGNHWTCMLSRAFPEVEIATDPGDPLFLEWDQRYAIEACYDYGYVDVSEDGGGSWTSLCYVTNPGFACSVPGMNQDWHSTHPIAPGHMTLDLGEYAGQPLWIRYRFVSDYTLSSQDYPFNPPSNSVVDGAWQVDNIHLYTLDGYDPVTVFLDDCESPGSNGWVTEDTPASGQTGVVYRRSYEEFDGHAGWMMVACDTLTHEMVSHQYSSLYSPPIHTAGASELVVRWEGWLDVPDDPTHDDSVIGRHAESEDPACIVSHQAPPGYYHWAARRQEPHWACITDTFSYDGVDWFGLVLEAVNWGQAIEHGVGFAVDRVRVGVPLATGVDDVGAGTARVSAVLPNPSGRNATVRFTITEPGQVVLRVYDLAGRSVRTLVDDVREPGEHEAVWDGTTDTGDRAASGVYFVRMTASDSDGSFSDTRKVVLLK